MRTVRERLNIRRLREEHNTPVTIAMPDDVIEDLKEIATLRGFSRFEALVRAYVGHGMRLDIERLQGTPVQRLADSLRKQGLSEQAIADVFADVNIGEHQPTIGFATSEVA